MHNHFCVSCVCVRNGEISSEKRLLNTFCEFSALTMFTFRKHCDTTLTIFNIVFAVQLHNVVFLLFKCVCLQFTAFFLLQRARKSEQFNLYNRKMNSRFHISIVQLYGNLETVSRYAQTRVVCILYICNVYNK